jgi:hypothetical protein
MTRRLSSSVSRVRRALLASAMVALVVPPLVIRLRYRWVHFVPELFITEYLKFLGSIVSVTFGWVLVQVLWTSRERALRTTQLLTSTSGLLDKLIRLNLDTAELLSPIHDRWTVAERDQYVYANINRQRDLIDSFVALHSQLLLSSHTPPALVLRYDDFIEELSLNLTALTQAPYDHIRNVPQEPVHAIGRCASAFLTYIRNLS